MSVVNHVLYSRSLMKLSCFPLSVTPVLAIADIEITQPVIRNVSLEIRNKHPQRFFMRNDKNIFLRLALQPAIKAQHALLVVQ